MVHGLLIKIQSPIHAWGVYLARNRDDSKFPCRRDDSIAFSFRIETARDESL